MTETLDYTCFHCGRSARGILAEAKGAFSTTTSLEYRIAGPVCSSCGIFICDADRQTACKAAGVKTKDCPSCRGKKVWTQQLRSPMPEAAIAVPSSCSGCGKELSGRVVSIEEIPQLQGHGRTPSAYVCFNCGVAFCTKWKCIKPHNIPCPQCGIISSFTGRLVGDTAASKDFMAAYRRLEEESLWVHSERGRSKLEPVLQADAAAIIRRALPDGFAEPLNIARLVELGRADLVTDDVLTRITSLTDSRPAAAMALGRIALASGEPHVWNRVFDAIKTENAGSRGALVGYLALFPDDERVVATLSGLLGDTGEVPLTCLDANAPESELKYLGTLSTVGKVVNPAGIGGGPSTTVAKLARAVLRQLARGQGDTAAAASEAIERRT